MVEDEEKQQEEEEKGREEQFALTLENFKEAADNPAHIGVERLIIDSDTAAIRPWNKGDSKTKEKDETIIAALKEALQVDFSTFSSALIEKIVEEELPHSSKWSMFEKLQRKPALSTATLQRILANADNTMAERAFVEEENSFTLQDFRNALAHPDNKEAERLIIRGKGVNAMIVAQPGSNHIEDTLIRKTLKRTLENEKHHENFVHELVSKALPWEIMTRARPSLSFKTLTAILQKADDAMNDSRLPQTTRSIAPHSTTVTNREAVRKLFRAGIEIFFMD